MKTAVLIVALIAVAASAPKSKPNARITWGQEAVPNSIPYQVLLIVQYADSSAYAGGSLIAPNVVLTAAHNVDKAVGVTAVLGAHKLSVSEINRITISSADIIIHPEYNSLTISNDIALIKLPLAITSTDAIQPVKLPGRADVGKTYTGEIAIVSGYGLTNINDQTESDVLNYANVEVISNEDCAEYFGALPSLDSRICTSGAQNTGICAGDSGGPLVVDGVLIGTASFGASFCKQGAPSGYARTTSFLDFIADNTNIVIN